MIIRVFAREKIKKYMIYLLLLITVTGCGKKESHIKKFPVNSLEGVISSYNLDIDREVTYDGLGSIRVESEDSATAYLYIINDVKVKNSKLTWQAHCKSESLRGNARLEIGLTMNDKDRRGLRNYLHTSLDSITGSTDWKVMEVSFMIGNGNVTELIQLNLIIEGKGTVWIDNIRFKAKPLP